MATFKMLLVAFSVFFLGIFAQEWLPKKGKCPILETSDECEPFSDLQSSCLFDGECSGDQKCCTDGCHLFCVAPRKQAVTKKPPPKKARCPVVKATQDCLPNRNKEKGCLVDSDCPRGKACCSDGCGLYCVTVKPKKKHVTKPWRSRLHKNGRCLIFDGPLSDCPVAEQTTCILDFDCPGDQKCCSKGCQNVCAKPVKE